MRQQASLSDKKKSPAIAVGLFKLKLNTPIYNYNTICLQSISYKDLQILGHGVPHLCTSREQYRG